MSKQGGSYKQKLHIYLSNSTVVATSLPKMVHRNDRHHHHNHYSNNKEDGWNEVSGIHQNVWYRNVSSMASSVMMLVITTTCLLSFISVWTAQFNAKLLYNHTMSDDTAVHERHRRQTSSNSTISPIVTNQTNSTFRNVSMTNTTTGRNATTSVDYNHTTLNYTFCKAP